MAGEITWGVDGQFPRTGRLREMRMGGVYEKSGRTSLGGR